MMMSEAISRARKRRYPGFWDYRFPRSAQEYLDNNVRRRRHRRRQMLAAIQHCVVICAYIAVLALLIGWAV